MPQAFLTLLFLSFFSVVAHGANEAASGCTQVSYDVAKKGIESDVKYLTCNEPLAGFCWSLFSIAQPTTEQIAKIDQYLTKLKAYDPLTKLGGSPILSAEQKAAALFGLYQGVRSLKAAVEKIEESGDLSKIKSGEAAFEEYTKEGFALLDAKFEEFDKIVAEQKDIKKKLEAVTKKLDGILNVRFETLSSDSYSSTNGFVRQGDIYNRTEESRYGHSIPFVKVLGSVELTGEEVLSGTKVGQRLAAIGADIIAQGEAGGLDLNQTKIIVNGIESLVSKITTETNFAVRNVRREEKINFSSADSGFRYPDRSKVTATIEGLKRDFNVGDFIDRNSEFIAMTKKLETLMNSVKAANNK